MTGSKELYMGGMFSYAALRGSIKAVVCCFSKGHLDLQASEIMDAFHQTAVHKLFIFDSFFNVCPVKMILWCSFPE